MIKLYLKHFTDIYNEINNLQNKQYRTNKKTANFDQQRKLEMTSRTKQKRENNVRNWI